jgi:hypothetical protein
VFAPTIDTVNVEHILCNVQCNHVLAAQERDLVLIALALQRQVAQPAIGVDDAAWCDRILH